MADYFGGGGFGGFGGMANYGASYTGLLEANNQNYQNILGAYGAGQNALSSQLPGIYGGYQGVLGQVQQTLGQGGGWGVATPAAQAIEESFARTRGQTDQAMISAGLGNTTVRGNLQNQNALMAGRAYGSLGAQLAQTYAGYQAQLGTAGLAARMQGTLAQSNLYGQLGSTLASQRYPISPYGYGGAGGGGGGLVPGVTPISGPGSPGPSRGQGGYGGGGYGGGFGSGWTPATMSEQSGGGTYYGYGAGGGDGYSGGGGGGYDTFQPDTSGGSYDNYGGGGSYDDYSDYGDY